MMKRPTDLLWMVFAVCLLPLQSYAESKTITATGEYRMRADDTLSEAQRLARVTAQFLVLEQAVVYLETVSGVKQLGLNREELRAYSVGILDIRPDSNQMANAEGARLVSVPMSIVLDPSVVTRQLELLMQNERAKTELMQIRDKIDAYQKELNNEQERLTTRKDAEDAKLALQHRGDILNLIDTEIQLAHTWTSLLGARERTHPEGRATEKNGAAKKELTGTPDNAEEHRKKGALLTQQGNYDAALAEFRLALRLVPDLDRAHLGIGAALQGKGDLDGAIAEYHALLQRHPNDPDTHDNLGSALQQKGDVTAAIGEYRMALQFRPNDALTHFNLGTAFSMKDQVDEAIGEYRTAIRLNPDLVQAYFNLGSLLKDKDQTREAVEVFREYVRRAPNTPVNKPWIEKAQTFLTERTEQRRHERQ